MAAVNPPQRVGVIDRASMTLEEVDVFFPRPHALAVDPRGHRFFAASLGQNSVAWAPIGDEDVDLMEVEGMMNHMLVQFAVSPDGRWMVGGGQMTGDLLVFDLSGEASGRGRVARRRWAAVAPRLDTGRPLRLDPEPGGQHGDRGRCRGVDGGGRHRAPGAHRAARLGRLAGRAHDLRVEPERGRRRIARHDGSEGRPGTVVAIDAESHEVLAVIEVGRYAAGMAGPAVAPGGR